jgi:hypothetical protein
MEEVPQPPRPKGLLELVLQAQQGSEEAWEKLFETVERVVRRRCLLDKPRILKGWIGDSDLVQEVGTFPQILPPARRGFAWKKAFRSSKCRSRPGPTLR